MLRILDLTRRLQLVNNRAKKWNEVAGGGIASDLGFTRTSARVGFHQDGGTDRWD